MALGFYFQDRLSLGNIQAAQLFSAAMMASSVAMLVAQFGVVQRWQSHPMKLTRLVLPILIAGYFLIANVYSSIELIVAMACMGFGMALAGPSINVTATLMVGRDEQGGLAGLIASVPE